MLRTPPCYCYVPPGTSMEWLEAFRPFIPERMVFMVHAPIEYDPKVTQVVVPQASPYHHMSDFYAFYAFCRVIQDFETRFPGEKMFMYVETDCRFTKPNWLDILYEEWFKERDYHWRGTQERVPAELTCAGTPVIWHAWSSGSAFSRRAIEYAAHYLEKSAMPLSFEGGWEGETAIYPNGAIAFYGIGLLRLAFRAFLNKIDSNPQDFLSLALEAKAFDWHLGKFIHRSFGLRAFGHVLPLHSSYSGCLNHRVGLEERAGLYFSKAKVAIHHLKDSELLKIQR